MKRAEKLPYSPLYWLLFSAVQVSEHLAAEESYGLSGVENQTKARTRINVGIKFIGGPEMHHIMLLSIW